MDLTFLSHSSFLNALGGAILNSFLQGFLLWLLYEMVILFHKNTTARFKHVLSVLLIFCSFTWFIATFILQWGATEKAPDFASGVSNLENFRNGSQSFLPMFLTLSGDILPYLSLAYIFLVFFFVAKFFSAYGQIHLMRHKNFIKPPVHLQAFVGSTARQLGISKTIIIRISHHVKVPATIGFLKPLILIPFASVNQLTVSQLEAIILHELSHIKRHDYLVNLAVSAIGTLLFFNPFIGIFIKIIKRERENCCDDFVLKYHRDPFSYAAALLRLAQCRRAYLQLSLPAVSGKNELLMRIKRITGQSMTAEFHYAHKLLTLIITTIIFCSLGWLSHGLHKKVKNVSLKTNHMIVPQIKAEAISKIGTTEKNREPNRDMQNEKGQQKIKDYREIKAPLVKQPNRMIAVEPKEKNKGADENLHNRLLLDIDPAIPASSTDNSHTISAMRIGSAGVNIDEIVEKEIQRALATVTEFNFLGSKNHIEKSFSRKKTDELSAKGKATSKHFSEVEMDMKLAGVSKILNDIHQQQILIAHSYRMESLPLISTEKARLAEQFKRSELIILNNSTKNFEFQYGPLPGEYKTGNNKKTADGERAMRDYGEKSKINVGEAPLQYETLPDLNKKVKQAYQVIIEI